MAALTVWARALGNRRPEVTAVGYFGSYARGDWGVGSDVDVVVVVSGSDQGFPRRAVEYPATDLPVPADVLAYTQEEWNRLDPGNPPRAGVIWVHERAERPIGEGRSP